MKPWHLKLSVQLFDEKGQPEDNGTIEEWWNSPEVDRREYKTGSYTATEIRKVGKLYRTKGLSSPSHYLELLREQAIHPMPPLSPSEVTNLNATENFGKVSLECIVLSQPISNKVPLPIGLFPTYCFDPGKDVLRASFEFGPQTVMRNAFGTFQGRAVAINVVVMSETTKVASYQLTSLERASVPDSEFAVSDDSVEQPLGPVRVSTGVTDGNNLTKTAPIFPESAKQRHVSGAVIMHAIIGTDGHIRALSLLSAPDPDLALSAIEAVKKWTYKPYMLQGVPVDVETSITVNYAYGP